METRGVGRKLRRRGRQRNRKIGDFKSVEILKRMDLAPARPDEALEDALGIKIRKQSLRTRPALPAVKFGSYGPRVGLRGDLKMIEHGLCAEKGIFGKEPLRGARLDLRRV